jgi:alpha-L-fucosidase 2
MNATRYLLFLLLAALGARAEMKSDIEFARPGGTSLCLDAFVPEGAGPFPACILVHGGGFTKGDKRTFITPLFEPLGRAGFAWFSIDYRLAPGHRFPACVEDVESAIRWVKAHAADSKVDPDRIALIGESAGGHLVSLAGVRATKETRVAAVVPFYAPHDLESRVRQSATVPPWLGALFGLTETNEATWKVLRGASPLHHIRPGLPPYLLVHGTKDDKVPFEQSLRFREKTRAAGNRCDLITIEGGAHGMGGWEKIDPSYREKLVEWLREVLSASPRGSPP